MVLDPIHPNEKLEQSLLAVTAAMLLLLVVQWLFGHWDKFIAVAVKFWPLWNWGG